MCSYFFTSVKCVGAESLPDLIRLIRDTQKNPRLLLGKKTGIQISAVPLLIISPKLISQPYRCVNS